MSASTDIFAVVLVHIMNRERVTMPVEHIANTYISIRWGQSGIYDLNLKDNKLTARSQKAQRKGKALWQAEDIAAVRHMTAKYLAVKRGASKNDELRASIERHEAAMPKFNPRIEDSTSKPQS